MAVAPPATRSMPNLNAPGAVSHTQAKGERTTNLIGAAMSFAILLVLAWRLTRGVDFEDESYYAIFIDDWLKGGIHSSALLALHQTAALIVYPAAWLYTGLVGSHTGLMLFLRGLFLLGNALAASCWFTFLRRTGFHGSAWAAAAAVLAFIPFGLPAPSYNTLGLQGLSVGLTAFGAAQFAEYVRARWAWSVVSALGWAVATVAYPSLIAVLGLFLCAGLAALPVVRLKAWVGIAVFFQIAAWSGVVIGLSSRKLHDGFVYVATINDVDGWSRKVQFSAQLFASHKVFACACLLSAAIGIGRDRLGPMRTSVAVALLLLLTISVPPTLFVHSHDLILVLALSGLGILAGFRPGASPQRRLFAVLYLTAMSAGVVTTLSAYNSLYNFCIGGAPAAILALVAPNDSRPIARLAITGRTSLAAAALLASALIYFYGDLPGVTAPRERIGWGVFAGLALQPDQAAVLRVMRDDVGPLVTNARTVAEVGRLPGLILATPARPLMPSVNPAPALTQDSALRANASYFASHPADIVLVYTDLYFDAPNPYGPSFSQRYALAARFAAPPGMLEVFRYKGSD